MNFSPLNLIKGFFRFIFNVLSKILNTIWDKFMNLLRSPQDTFIKAARDGDFKTVKKLLTSKKVNPAGNGNFAIIYCIRNLTQGNIQEGLNIIEALSNTDAVKLCLDDIQRKLIQDHEKKIVESLEKLNYIYIKDFNIFIDKLTKILDLLLNRTPIKTEDQPVDPLLNRTPIKTEGQPVDPLLNRTPIKTEDQPVDPLLNRTPIKTKDQPVDPLLNRTPIKTKDQPLVDNLLPAHIKTKEPTLKEASQTCNIPYYLQKKNRKSTRLNTSESSEATPQKKFATMLGLPPRSLTTKQGFGSSIWGQNNDTENSTTLKHTISRL